MNAELIKGNDVLTYFEQLIKQNTYIKIQAPDQNYENIIVISAIKFKNNFSFFLIDLTDDLKSILSNGKSDSFLFEFKGENKINYAFKTTGFHLGNDKIWIKLPCFIERLQRRSSFRIFTPVGAKIFFGESSKKYEMNLVNISIGGFCSVPLSLKIDHKKFSVVKTGRSLINSQLYLPEQGNEQIVQINKLKVTRVEKNSFTSRLHYCGQFLEIDKQDERILTTWIYKLQRKLLQKRL